MIYFLTFLLTMPLTILFMVWFYEFLFAIGFCLAVLGLTWMVCEVICGSLTGIANGFKKLKARFKAE